MFFRAKKQYLAFLYVFQTWRIDVAIDALVYHESWTFPNKNVEIVNEWKKSQQGHDMSRQHDVIQPSPGRGIRNDGQAKYDPLGINWPAPLMIESCCQIISILWKDSIYRPL